MENWKKIVTMALKEDKADQDITSKFLIPASLKVWAEIIAMQNGVFCGAEIVRIVFSGHQFKIKEILSDGSSVKKNQLIAQIYGPAREILSRERTLLNLIQRLSGISSLTAKFVRAVRPYPVKIYDTRKTTPGLRNMEKYAVRCGGGYNHRLNLSDMVLIKDNHLALLKNIDKQTINKFPKKIRVELETESFPQVKQALTLGVDIIMLDNFPLSVMDKAIRLIKKQRGDNEYPQIEVSGGLNLENIPSVARLQPDRISIGVLTHSAPALDISLEIQQRVPPFERGIKGDFKIKNNV
ncbi:MAG: carboxylating nicotinate-nucleotide diphosphorylase [Elusimicrobiota bacterium]